MSAPWPFPTSPVKVTDDKRRYVVTRRSSWGTKQYRNADGGFSYNPVFAARFTAEEADALAVDGAVREVAP
jgi:hypothetical protein